MIKEPNQNDTTIAPDKMAEVVKLITKLGPDISLISRISGTYVETVRYWYKEKILAKGMSVQAVPNEAALGMKRVAARVRVAQSLLPRIHPTFLSMNDLSFAEAFEMSTPEEYYFLHAMVPEEFVSDYRFFIMELKEKGIFESAELYEFDWFRRIPMRAESYDFEASRWDYDWQRPLPIEKEEMRPESNRKVKLDKTDLLILKELQFDAGRSLTDINRAIMEKNKVELNYKTMQWHYSHHVVEGGLINGYSVRWLGAKHNGTTERTDRRQHSYLVINVVIKDLTYDELLALRRETSLTPFLWREMGGRDYFAQFAFPVESAIEAFEYLRYMIRPFAGRAEQYIVDQKNAAQFLLPYKMWNELEKQWKFEKNTAAASIESQFMTRVGTDSKSGV